MTEPTEFQNATDPEACQSMAQVREGVDAVDSAIISLLAKRFGYMKAAARIKEDRATVRDERRKAEVIGKVKAAAEEMAVPVPLVAAMWEMLVESSIAYELVRYDEVKD